MKYSKSKYGKDADGNRGRDVVETEIEDVDEEEILDQLYDNFIMGTISGKVDVSISVETAREVWEDVPEEVNVQDYMDALLVRMKKDPDIEPEEVEEVERLMSEYKSMKPSHEMSRVEESNPSNMTKSQK